MRGRPRKPVDGGLVERLASFGLGNEEIAEVMGVSSRLLKRRFAAELVAGRERLRLGLVREVLLRAKRGDVHAMIWLCHCLAAPGPFLVPLWNRRPPQTPEQLDDFNQWIEELIMATQPESAGKWSCSNT